MRHAQGGEYTIRTAVGRDNGAIIPGAVTVAEKVVAGFFREIRSGKIKAPASG
jgi:hypothetical protein